MPVKISLLSKNNIFIHVDIQGIKTRHKHVDKCKKSNNNDNASNTVESPQNTIILLFIMLQTKLFACTTHL